MEQKLGILSRTAVGQECMLVVFVEQPQPRGMRFRYPCEGHSAGSLFGENSTEANRTYPTLQLLKYTIPVPVELMICLVTADQPYKPHPHNLVGKNCRDGIYRVELPPGTHEHMFSSVGIQCCKKNDVRNIILKRLSDGIDPFDVKDQALQTESINLNSVRLCVQPALLYSYGRQVMPPTVSDIIYDKKNTCASILKIIRFNKIAGSVLGDDEVILLCDKVQKDNIKVRFFLDNWEAWGIFSANDVHRQIAITFKTPPYKDPCISSPVEVYLQLFRPSDRVTSEAKPYSFIPQCKDPHGLIRKRWMNNTAHCFPQDASLSLPFLPPNETPCSSIEHARENVAIRRRIGSYSHSSNVLVGRGLQPASVIPMAVLPEAPVMEMGACSMSSGELGSLIQQQATEEEQEKLFQLINQELLVSSGMLEPSISPLFSETIAEVYPAPYDDPPVVTTPNNFNLASAGGLISSDVMLSQVREQDSLTEEGVLFAPLTHLTEEL